VIELVITMAIIAIMVGLGLFVSLEFYRSSDLNSERDILLSVMRRARTQALDNVYGLQHGVFVSPSSYIIFAGSSYASRAAQYDETFPRSNAISVSGLSEIVFSALASTSTSSGTIILADATASTTMSVNNEGQINW